MSWVKITKEDKLALTKYIKAINKILGKYNNTLPNWVLCIDRAQSAGRELEKQIKLLGIEED